MRGRPSIKYLELTSKSIDIVASWKMEVEALRFNNKLASLTSHEINCQWVTKGKLGRGMFQALGVMKLHIL